MELITTFKSAIVEFDTTQSIIGAHADLKASRVSRGLTEEIPFDAAESQAISETIAAMRDLQASMPLPIDWSRIGKVKPSIDKRRKELRDTVNPIVKRCWYIRLNSLTWLKSMRENEPMPTYNFQIDGAAFESTALAEEVVRRLRAIGVQSKMDLLTAERRASTITRGLEEIGFAPKEQNNDGTNANNN
jgi:hypothetical protein